MRVLIIEDDHALGVYLQKALALDGHAVELTGDGESGLALAARIEPDLMILDLSLPSLDGMDVLTTLRRDLPSISILVISARSKECVRCLNTGADDFLAKPFSSCELMARCRALMRRRLCFIEPHLHFGAVDLNQLDHTATYSGVPVSLTKPECRVLVFLVQLQGTRISRSGLLLRLGQAQSSPSVQSASNAALHRRLPVAEEIECCGDSAVVTVRGVGFRLRCTCHSQKPCLIHPRTAMQPHRHR